MKIVFLSRTLIYILFVSVLSIPDGMSLSPTCKISSLTKDETTSSYAIFSDFEKFKEALGNGSSIVFNPLTTFAQFKRRDSKVRAYRYRHGRIFNSKFL